MNQKFLLALKGFAMGLADIVPGVSGGTVAFVVGIYDRLLESIASVNGQFIKLLLSFKIREALAHIQFGFLAPLFAGIASAILLTSRLMHYLMKEEPVLTWSLFFGLICASCIYIGKKIKKESNKLAYAFFPAGIALGLALVSLVPIDTPNTTLYVFGAGAIAICAMILPGISGSFILLILGKYAFITGALKNPLGEGNLLLILTFCVGCLFGLLSFSKVLNFLMHKYSNKMMLLLTGFMVGSLKKIWPWKETLETTVIRGKEYILKEANIFPSEFNQETIFAFLIMFIGFSMVLGLEYMASKFRPESETES